MKIAFIGVGGIAGTYRRVLSTLQRPIAAVCDIAVEAAVRAGQEECAAVYTNPRKMLADIAPDAVFICLPPGEHTTQAQDAAEFGSAVFVTRPVALNPAVARHTRDAIAHANVINQVGYVSRYSDATIKAKQLLRDTPLAMGTARLAFRMKAGHPWWGDPKKSGGQIVEQATSVFDLLRYFLGEVSQVQGFGVRDVSAPAIADFEECAVINLRFAGGAIGTVSTTCVAAAEEGPVIELVGDDVYLKLTGDLRVTGNIHGAKANFEGVERGYHRQIKRFLDAVEKHDQSMVLSNYADAVKTLAVTLAANLSLRSGQPLTVGPASPPSSEPTRKATTAKEETRRSA